MCLYFLDKYDDLIGEGLLYTRWLSYMFINDSENGFITPISLIMAVASSIICWCKRATRSGTWCNYICVSLSRKAVDCEICLRIPFEEVSIAQILLVAARRSGPCSRHNLWLWHHFKTCIPKLPSATILDFGKIVLGSEKSQHNITLTHTYTQDAYIRMLSHDRHVMCITLMVGEISLETYQGSAVSMIW